MDPLDSARASPLNAWRKEVRTAEVDVAVGLLVFRSLDVRRDREEKRRMGGELAVAFRANILSRGVSLGGNFTIHSSAMSIALPIVKCSNSKSFTLVAITGEATAGRLFAIRWVNTR